MSVIALRQGTRASFEDGWEAGVARRAEGRELVRLAFHHFHSMVFATCARLTTRLEAEDLTQDVFLALFEETSRLRDAARVPGFLKTCAVRLSLHRLRRARHHLAAVETASRGQTQDRAPETAGYEVRALLDRLDAEERTVVVLRLVEEHTVDEIVALTSLSSSTVKRRLLSAHEKVRLLEAGAVRTALLEPWGTP
jgi:RNA polymerase sigma-70 factor (ECF subfamily)